MGHGGDIYRNKVKMDFSVNLNPAPVPEAIRSAMEEGMKNAGVYPDPEQESVRSALAELERVETDNIFAGNGASEMILAAVRAVSPRMALLIEPGFSGIRHALQSLPSVKIREFHLREDQGFTLTRDILTMLDEDVDLLYLADPWNPTGQNPDPGLLDEILQAAAKNHIMVLLDQSFYLLSAAGREAGIPENLRRYFGNLIIIRSFTKLFALPGIRMGYAVSSPDHIRHIRKQLPEWNLSSAAGSVMTAGAALLKDGRNSVFDHADAEKERLFLSEALKNRGFRVYPSDTIFLLFRAPEGLYERFLARGVLIRDCSDYPGLNGYCRIAVKDHGSNLEFLGVLDEIIREGCTSYGN